MSVWLTKEIMDRAEKENFTGDDLMLANLAKQLAMHIEIDWTDERIDEEIGLFSSHLERLTNK